MSKTGSETIKKDMFRPIQVQSHLFKLAEHSLINAMKRLGVYSILKTDAYQQGFKPDCSVLTHQVALLKILKDNQQRNGHPGKDICTFVDFSKAYDTVDRTKLEQILLERADKFNANAEQRQALKWIFQFF